MDGTCAIVAGEILDAPDPGFSVPYGCWMREPREEYLRDVVLDSSSQNAGPFDPPQLQRAITKHVQGRQNREHLLYKLPNLALSQREPLA